MGGDSVSRAHAIIHVDRGEYVYTDTDSTNGNEFFRPVTEGQRPTFSTSELAVEVEKATKFGRMVIGIGDQAIINITSMGDGLFIVTDGTPSRLKNAQRFRHLQEGQTIRIGNAQLLKKQLDRSEEEQFMHVPDSDIAAEELRLTIVDGNLYILNIAQKEFDIHFERLEPNPNPRVRKPKPRPTPPPPNPPPRPSNPPPSPDKGPEYKRKINTAVLLSEVEQKIRDLEKLPLYKNDRKKLYKQLIFLYHADRHPGDPDANRKMQLINKWYSGVGN